MTKLELQEVELRIAEKVAEAVAAARVQAFHEAAKYLLAHHGDGIYEVAEDIEAMK